MIWFNRETHQFEDGPPPGYIPKPREVYWYLDIQREAEKVKEIGKIVKKEDIVKEILYLSNNESAVDLVARRKTIELNMARLDLTDYEEIKQIKNLHDIFTMIMLEAASLIPVNFIAIYASAERPFNNLLKKETWDKIDLQMAERISGYGMDLKQCKQILNRIITEGKDSYIIKARLRFLGRLLKIKFLGIDSILMERNTTPKKVAEEINHQLEKFVSLCDKYKDPAMKAMAIAYEGLHHRKNELVVKAIAKLRELDKKDIADKLIRDINFWYKFTPPDEFVGI